MNYISHIKNGAIESNACAAESAIITLEIGKIGCPSKTWHHIGTISQRQGTDKATAVGDRVADKTAFSELDGR